MDRCNGQQGCNDYFSMLIICVFKALLISAKHAVAHAQYARALKLMMKIGDDRSTTELDQAIIEVCLIEIMRKSIVCNQNIYVNFNCTLFCVSAL